jgi:amino acid transporter
MKAWATSATGGIVTSGSEVRTTSAQELDGAPPRSRLNGNLGVIALLFTVMAFNAPLGTIVATIPVPIAFGNGAGAPVMFIFGAAVMALLAVGFIKMYPFMTNSGGFYVYITAGLGKVVGLGAAFLAQFSYCVLNLGASVFFGYTMQTLVVGFGGPGIPWWAYTLASLAAAGYLGYRQLDLSAKVLTAILITEITVIAAYNLRAIFSGGTAALDLERALDPSTIFTGSIGIALLVGVTCMGGFEATVIFREEVRDPERTIPRATFLFIGVVGAMYCITAWSMIHAVGSANAQEVYAADPAGSVLNTMQTYFTHFGKDLVLVLLNFSALAAVFSIHNVATRYAFNLGNDRILHRILARVHVKHDSPHCASVAVAAAVALAVAPFVVFGADPTFLYIQLLSSFSYAFLVMLVITCVAVAVFLMKRKPEGTSLWHRLIAPSLAFLGIGTTLIFATLNLDVLFGNTGAPVIIILSLFYSSLVLGMVVALMLRRKKPDIYALIGRQ